MTRAARVRACDARPLDRVTRQAARSRASIAWLAAAYAVTVLVIAYGASVDRRTDEPFSLVRVVILCLVAPIFLKYLLQLLIAPWYPLVERIRARRARPGGAYVPSVSVLVPAWNEEVGILSTVQSILDTRYPRLEVIVVNDGSTDRTHAVVTEFLARYRRLGRGWETPVRYRSVANGGKARALNIALAMARGDIVITIDADSVADGRAIVNLVKHFADPRVACVAGNVVIGTRARPIGLVQQLEYLYGFYFKRADSVLDSVYIVGGAAAAYRRRVLIEAGGFDETIITEDIEVSTRLQDLGHRIRYAADAHVFTEGPADFAGLCRQRLRWKFGRLLTFYKYRHLFFSRRPEHRAALTCVFLPMALFAEILLLFEAPLIALFYAHTFLAGDFAPLFGFIGLLAAIIGAQVLTDPRARYHRNLLAVAPVAWLVFYVVDLVEYQALLRSIRLLATGKTLGWQRWVRAGVWGDAAPPPRPAPRLPARRPAAVTGFVSLANVSEARRG